MTEPTAKRVSRELPKDIPSMSVPNGESPFAPGSKPMDFDTPDMPKSKAETEFILKSLLKSYVGIGTAVTLISPQDGYIIVANAEDLTESWRQLLDNDVKLRRIMKKAIQGSGWGAVISTHLMVFVPIISNHRESFQHLVKRKASFTDGDE